MNRDPAAWFAVAVVYGGMTLLVGLALVGAWTLLRKAR